MSQSEMLTAFYRSYAEWLRNGAEHNAPYNRYTGLCDAAFIYGDANSINAFVIKEEMRQQFIDAGLDRMYPFGAKEYDEDSNNRTQHLNEKRIKWVHDHAI